jgi:hypothetical protein
MRRLAASAVVGTAALLAMPGGAATAATAATLPKLPITGLTQVLEAGNHLFLNTANGVVVTNLAGKLVTKLPISGTGDMATDGSTVWVVIGRFVAAFSATTLKSMPSYDGPPSNNLYNIAYQAGKIWVVYGGSVPTSIGYFKVGNPTLNTGVSANKPWPGIPRLAADPNPTTEGTLVAVDNEAGSSMIATFNVSGAKPKLTPVAENDAVTGCTGLSDLAVTAGGTRLVLACTGGATDLGYATATLAPVTAADYASGASPDAVAIAPDNSGIATGTDDAATSALSVFKAGGAAVTTVPLASEGLTVAPDGLAWSPDATKLFAVLKGGANYYLDVLQYPQFKASSLDLGSTGTGTFPAGSKVLLKGKLTLGGAPAPAGVTVKVFRQVVGSSVATTLVARTVAGGTYTLTDTPPRYAHYYYTAYYPSDGTYAPNWHTALVIVTPLHTTLRLTAAPASVAAGKTVRVTARLGKTRSRVVAIYAQPAGGAKKLVKSGKVNAWGVFTVSYKITKKTTFTAVFAGDAYYAPAKATVTVK